MGPDSSENENKEASEGKYDFVFTGSEALFGSHRSTTLIKKNKIEAVFINEVHCVAKWFVFYSFHLYIVRKLSVIPLFVQLLFFCLKLAFVVFRGLLADISHLCTCKDLSSAILCKSNESEFRAVQRIAASKIRGRFVYSVFSPSRQYHDVLLASLSMIKTAVLFLGYSV